MLQVTRAKDYLGNVFEFRKRGGHAGKLIGFDTLAKAITWGRGVTYDFSGAPTSGKTQFVFEILINASKKYGHKHILFMPDAGTEMEIVAKIIHKLTGKTFDKRYKNYITETEILGNIDFVDNHFIFIKRSDFRDKVKPIDIWTFGVELAKDDKDIKSIVVDSWKDLYHDFRDFSGREDLYLAYTLKTRNDIAKESGLNIITIAHPSKPKKDKDGKMLPFNPYDIKGASAWFDNANMLVFVGRPDKDKNITEIDVRKAKPDGIGVEGVYYLRYDFAKSRYYEMIDGKKYFAFEYDKKHEQSRRKIEFLDDTDDTDEIPF